MRIEGNEIQTNQDVDSLLRQIRADPRTSNPRVLAINQRAQMRAKNNGYPQDMYHATLDPRSVNNEEEETAIASLGYQRTYILRLYPKVMYRRNLHPKFAKSVVEMQRIGLLTIEAQRIERTTVNEHDFIEERIVQNDDQEKKLLAEKAGKNTSAWVSSIGALEPMKQGPDEDPEVSIARLEGEASALRDALKQRKAS